MKRMLATGVTAFAITIALGVCNAFATLDVVLQVENKTTGEIGMSVSAAAGDVVRLTLSITNNGPRQDVDVHVVGGIPGCIVEVTQTKNFPSGRMRTKKLQRRVPAGHSGTFFVDVNAVGRVDGSAGSASATVDLGPLKVASGEPAPAPGLLQRIFVRMIANGLLEGVTSDPGSAQQTFGGVKSLYR